LLGIDTNLLIRFVTNDDVRQAKKVKQIFNEAEQNNKSFFVSLAVTLEFFWVLESGYDLSQDDVLIALESMLGLSILEFERENELMTLLNIGKKGDLSDQLIGIIGQSEGCFTTLTFDKKASRLEQFTLLK
jgi:predicted nucleic-acid-binding protein